MIRELFQLACQLHQAGNHQEALKRYAGILKIEPSFTPAHYNLGLLFLAEEQFEYARIQFNNVLELQDSFHKAKMHLAESYLQLNQLDQAEKYFREYCEVDSDPDALNNLGVVYLRQQRAQEAVDCFTRALTLDPNRTDIRSNLAATFLNFDRYAQAITHYEEILKDTSDLECHYNIAVALTAMGEFSQATKHYEKILEITPEHIDSHTNLGAIALHQGHRETAGAYFTHALTLNPEMPIARFLLSALKGKAEQFTPPEYSRNLFDHYAVHYDRHLLNALRYRLPTILREIFNTITFLPPKPWRILDCGSGTGLIGELFKSDAAFLCGIDISEKMLKIAADKHCYHELHCIDLREGLAKLSSSFDIVFFADVFGYCGDLSEILKNSAARLNPGGVIAFSVEISEQQDYQLQSTARFSYSTKYLEKLRQDFSWKEPYSKTHTIRYQDNQPVNAKILVWGK